MHHAFLDEIGVLMGGRPAGFAAAPLVDRDVDYALLLAWNFKTEIMNNLTAFKEKGGKFIIPIPSPVIVDPNEYQHVI